MKLCIALLLLTVACSNKGPYENVVVGKQFPLLDALPATMKSEDWKTVKWVNVDAQKMSKDGGTCTGHAGVLERVADHQHWVVVGASCGSTPLTGDTGARFEAHPIPSASENDTITLQARFVEALEEGVYALWTSAKIVKEKAQESDAVRDEFLLRRRGNQLVKLIEITNEGSTGAELEGGFPKTFVVKTGNAEQRLIYKEIWQRYAHESYRSNEFAGDGGVNTAKQIFGDAGVEMRGLKLNHHDP